MTAKGQRFSYLHKLDDNSPAEQKEIHEEQLVVEQEIQQEAPPTKVEVPMGNKERESVDSAPAFEVRAESKQMDSPSASTTKSEQSTDVTATGAQLESVRRGEGRMKQEREQLNVRIPTTLKRRAVAKAVLEGLTIGEVVETLLRQYINEAT